MTPKTIIFTAIALLSCMLLLLACSKKLDERLKEYEIAHNNHDIQGAVEMYTEDAVFESVGLWQKEGRVELMYLEMLDSALNSMLTFSDIFVSGDTVMSKVIENNDWFDSAGIDAVSYDYVRFIYRDGLIAKVESKISEESARQIQQTQIAFFNWAKENRSEQLTLITKEGQPIFEPGNIDTWLRLLSEWRLETGQQI